jgi:enamine deaminase RidA (YjgF/YER057c/UK114 family)
MRVVQRLEPSTHGGDFAERVRMNHVKLTSELRLQYDFIVCGLGSSGSVVARRLAENPDVTALLLEGGGCDDVSTVMEADQWPANLGSDQDWAFQAQPNPHLNGRSIPMNMGKVLGGGFSINVMIWARRPKNDWDYFASEAGDSAWNFPDSERRDNILSARSYWLKRFLIVFLLSTFVSLTPTVSLVQQPTTMSAKSVAKLPFSPGLELGDTLYVSGHLGVDPAVGEAPDDPEEEARQVLHSVELTLKEAGIWRLQQGLGLNFKESLSCPRFHRREGSPLRCTLRGDGYRRSECLAEQRQPLAVK